MIIRKQFLQEYKKHQKTIELIKVSELQEILEDEIEHEFSPDWEILATKLDGVGETGRIFSSLGTYDENGMVDTIGRITIKDYSIIENFLNKFDKKQFNVSHDNVFDLSNQIIPLWIYKHWDYLKEYYKDEKEIMILNIENFR